MLLPIARPNQALEPTPSSLRYASASGRGSPPALAALSLPCKKREHKSAVPWETASERRIGVGDSITGIQETYGVASAPKE